jgi:DNA adenine methylase
VNTNNHVLDYPGAKWNLAPWIIEHFPPHEIYVEPFFGSGAVFFAKKPAKHEVINDLSKEVYNLFRIIRDHPYELATVVNFTAWDQNEYELAFNEDAPSELERARRFLVRCWMTRDARHMKPGTFRTRQSLFSPSRTDQWNNIPDRIWATTTRFKDNVEIWNIKALDVINKYMSDDSALIYLDPPYKPTTRAEKKLYGYEMSNIDHAVLLDVIRKVRGAVVLSGYDSELYSHALPDWHIVRKNTLAVSATKKEEVLWMNHRAKVGNQMEIQWV